MGKKLQQTGQSVGTGRDEWAAIKQTINTEQAGLTNRSLTARRLGSRWWGEGEPSLLGGIDIWSQKSWGKKVFQKLRMN